VIVSQLNEALEASRHEVHRLHEERDRYEEAMKKAFMRGVCALNLEAMTMFHESEAKNGAVPPGSVCNTVGSGCIRSSEHVMKYWMLIIKKLCFQAATIIVQDIV